MFKMTRKTLFTLVTIITVLLYLSSCASAPSSANPKRTASAKTAPAWVSGEDKNYPDSQYLTGVGYASTREKAESDAIAFLVKQIRQDVLAQSAAAQEMSETDAGFSSERKIVDTVVTTSNITSIPGVSIAANWADSKGTEYALAVLNRSQTGAYYAGKAEDLEKTINTMILYAQKNPATFEGYSSLRKAGKLAIENQENLDLLAGINPIMRQTVQPEYGSSSAVEALAQRALEKIIIGVYVDGDIDERVSRTLAVTINERGFRTGNVEVSDKVVPYILISSFELQDVELGSGEKKFVRYVINVALTDTRTGKILLPYTANSREAHLTEVEAQQRAIRAAEKNITENFGDAFDELLETYSK